jgi:hypothetical protein
MATHGLDIPQSRQQQKTTNSLERRNHFFLLLSDHSIVDHLFGMSFLLRRNRKLDPFMSFYILFVTQWNAV